MNGTEIPILERIGNVPQFPVGVDAVVAEESPRIRDIPIVCEFPDIFRDKLPGLPSDREIEFTIDLALGYYRRFIKDFAKIATPLTKLTRKNEKFVGDDKCEESFQELKNRLVTTPILVLPDEHGDFVIYNDASYRGLGCVLMQQGNVIAYASRQLKPYEQRYRTEFEKLEIEVRIPGEPTEVIYAMTFQSELLEKIRRCQEEVISQEDDNLTGEEIQGKKMTKKYKNVSRSERKLLVAKHEGRNSRVEPRFEVCDELGWRNIRGSIVMVEYVDGFSDKVTCGMAVDLHHGSIHSNSRWKMDGIIEIVSMEVLVVDARDFVDGYAFRMKNGSLELLEVTIWALVILKSWKNEMNGFLFEGRHRGTYIAILMVTIQPDLEYWVEREDCWG
ncbi:hypothetical protein AgCh_005241 [Apium graveolens]